MSDASATIPETMATASAKTAAQKATETAIDRILNGMMDTVSGKFGQVKIRLGTVFHTYLENAYRRYNQVRTLATGLEPQSIVGPNNIYVHIGVSYREKEIDTHTAENLLRLGNNLLIFGTGGIGKSMLMRYLFLNTINQGSRIPVLLELRKVGDQKGEDVSILELVYASMQDFNAKLPRDQFEYSLDLGKYLFLFDGLDEVPEDKSKQTAAAIQTFSAKYRKNAYIVTSRPSRDSTPLETFLPLDSMMMNKQQAVLLAKKLGNASVEEKTAAFCQQLEETLFDKHRDFAENPLLLSMMFLTFMYNNSIPEHLAEFYEKSYHALYSAHDSRDKGVFRREFKCKELDEASFKRLFSYFCFHTYYKEKYEFKKGAILNWLEKGIRKLALPSMSASDYLIDLCEAVCLIVRDGNIYRFAHRSFQTYFAALYVCSLTDQQQKDLFHNTLKSEPAGRKKDYYALLFQMQPDRTPITLLEDGLRELRTEAEKTENPSHFILKTIYTNVSIETNFVNSSGISKNHIRLSVSYEHLYQNNVTVLFRVFYYHIIRKEQGPSFNTLVQRIETLSSYETLMGPSLSFSSIDLSPQLTAEERSEFYQMLCDWLHIPEAYQAITTWLSDLDIKRAALSAPNFIDDL